MKNILVLDLETTGVQPEEDTIIEVGYVLWNLEHRTLLECYSSLLPSPSNAAERFNAIAPAVLIHGDGDIAWEIVAGAARQADVIVAHSARFDHQFVEHEPAKCAEPEARLDTLLPLLELPWICTMEDFIWPITSAYTSLVSVALTHGVAVTSAHRAINDCLLISRLFERLDDVDDRLHLALQRAMRPKAEFVAKTDYKQKDLVKAWGFHYNGMVWKRYMAIEDAEKLPFDVVNLDDVVEEGREAT